VNGLNWYYHNEDGVKWFDHTGDFSDVESGKTYEDLGSVRPLVVESSKMGSVASFTFDYSQGENQFAGFFPIIGSGLDAYSAFKEGNNLAGFGHLALAATDVMPIKAFAMIGLKGAAKGVAKFSKAPPGKLKKLKNGQGWLDETGKIWKKDMKHKDHWDITDPKTGKKVKEIDFDGNQIWPKGPKNKNKR